MSAAVAPDAQRSEMRHHDDPQTVREPAAVAGRLARYLGAGLAAELVAGRAREAEIYLAASQLAGARYAISTYLPRRLVARQLAVEGEGPWLEWVEGALLFADVNGSTALAERLTALGREGTEVVTETLNSYFGTMSRIIEQARGDLLTFGGDALLVLFDGPDPARVATATALALLRELAGFTREVPGIGAFPLTMHIGVEAGPVALVSAGHPQALRYSAMGRTVRDVARAEGHGGKGELVLGPRAWAAVAADAAGAPVPDAPGFVRVSALGGPPAPLPEAPAERPAPALSLEALDGLARQIDRVSPYLPPDLLARILADPNRPVVEADLRPVTVLFAEVAGLGPLVEGLPPAEAAAVVDATLRPLQTAVARLGGFVNKLDLAEEGDKLMAVFGAPVAHEDHAERAARAALLMLASLPQADPGARGPGELGRGAPALRLRIGLNTGNVFAGNVGTAGRKEYTVMGDAVNVAARVMGAAAWGEVRCAAATAAMVRHALVCDDPRRVAVKGKSEPLELLRLAGEREGAAEAEPAVPLVGRTGELAWLRGHLEGAAAGHGRAVRVQGEAGLGKSRLAAALLDEAAAAGARALTVRCLAYNSATPYAPWGELLRDLCGIGGGAGQAARRAGLANALGRAGVPADDWLPLMAELVGLDAEDNPIVRALDPGQRQARRFEIVLAMLRAAARGDEGQPTTAEGRAGGGDQGPKTKDQGGTGLGGGQPGIGQDGAALVFGPSSLVLCFDNLQWADQVSLDLWQHVAGHIAGDPILLLALHRGGLAWGSGPQGDSADVLELGPLPDETAAALLDALAAPPGLSDELRGRLVARAAGNPLFLEELLRAVEGAGQPSASEALDALPDSLSGLLLARIDRLDEHSRALLRVASVVGQRFPVGVIQSIHEADLEALVRRLVQLDHEELTATERERPERVHLFRHALLQEVAYQSLLYARRRELHRRIGEYLEGINGAELTAARAQYSGALVQIGRNGSLLSREARARGGASFLLAHHFRLSDQPERAVPYLLLAGHIARDDYANDQAIQHYRWALDILAAQPGAEPDPRVWEAREALGDALCTLGRYDEAIAEYTAVVEGEGAADRLPPAVAAEVLRSWGDALEKQGRYGEALARLRGAEALCRERLSAVPPLLLAAVYADMGQVLRRLGEFDQALAICQTGLSKIRDDRRSAEDERIEADLQQLMGTLYAMRGDYEAARFHFENALAAQEAIDDLYGLARSHNNLGYLAQLRSDYARAVRHYGEAETTARKISAKYILSSVVLNAAYGYYRLDRYAEAEAACRDAMALCEEMGDRDGIAKAYDTLGVIAAGRGAYAEAERCHERALALHRAQEATYEEGNTLALLALALLGQGRTAEARALAEQSLEVARRTQAPQLEAEALSALAEADLAAADAPGLDRAARAALLARAAQAAEAAEACAARIGSKLDQGVALRLLGEVAARREPGRACVAHFEAALALFAAIRSGLETARVEARLGAALAARNDPAAAAYLERAETTFLRIGAAGELRRLGRL